MTARYSSLNGAGDTAFADPPLAVLGVMKSCSVMAPVEASSANAEIYPGDEVERERVLVMMYLGNFALVLANGIENLTSSAQ